MNQEIIEKYLILLDSRGGADAKLQAYQLRQFVREIAQTRPSRENALWKQIAERL
jgi:hypothetical protein